MFTQGVYYFEMIAMNKPQLYVDSKEPLYLHGNCFFLKAYFEVAELIEVNCLAAVYRRSSINLSFCGKLNFVW